MMAGAATLGDLASAIGIRTEQAAIVAELKAGSEDAYAWLIGEFHQPVYSLVYRIVADPSDASDTTQEVFLKVFADETLPRRIQPEDMDLSDCHPRSFQPATVVVPP